jgi:DNA repair exonuclease SbcCD ATPase subunit
MKLRKLTVKKYRNHVDSTLAIGDATYVVVRGANAAGKTSLLEAFGMNVTGTAVSLAADGKGFKGKIAQGEKESTIIAEIQGQHLLRNTMTLSVGAGGRTSSVECLDVPDDKKIINGFSNFLADRKPALLIATSTDYFSKLDEEKQANLLAKLVLPAHHDFPEDKMDAVDEALGEGIIDFDANPFDVITKAHKKLYDERQEVNRKVRDFVIPDALPKPKDVDSASLQKEVDDARAQRTKLQKERDEAVAKANEIEVKRGRLQTKIEGLRSEVEKGKKRLTELEATILNAEALKALQAVAGKKAELDSLKEQHAGILGAIRTANQQIDRLRGINEQGATCPVCDQDIDSGKITNLIADLQKESADEDAKIQKLDKQIEAIGDVHAAQESLRKHEAAVKEKDTLEKSLLETVATGKATKAEIEALGEVVNATLPFNDPLSSIEAKITSILEKLGPVAAAEERARDIKVKTEQLAKLQAKAASLDNLTNYFGKDGVKADLIGQYVGSFESKLKEVMSAWGYECSLSMEPFSFEVKTARGYVGPVKEISGAEEHIFKVAFQCAVSIAAGINLVVIDEVEELGEDIRPLLYSTIYQLIQDGKLEQAILIGFSLDKRLPKPQAPGSKYFFVENGTVEELR